MAQGNGGSDLSLWAKKQFNESPKMYISIWTFLCELEQGHSVVIVKYFNCDNHDDGESVSISWLFNIFGQNISELITFNIVYQSVFLNVVLICSARTSNVCVYIF